MRASDPVRNSAWSREGSFSVRSIFDGHLDLALFALAYNRDMTEPAAVSNQREEGMTDALERGLGAVSLPEMRQGRIAVCQSSLAARVITRRGVAVCQSCSLDRSPWRPR